MSEQETAKQPYIPADRQVSEITIRALILGGILSIVMGAANTYLGLYAGMTVAASIPAAVISMALLRGVLGGGSILENNIVQTMASTGESLAAGVIFTVPALVMVGAWQDFKFWPTTLIAMLGGLLGIIFMVPMRKALIVDRPDLIYPEGIACAEVLTVGEEKGTGIRYIAQGLVVGAVFKLAVNAFQAVQVVVEGAIAKGRTVLYMGSDMSVALMAVGYIVNLQIAALITLGGSIGWLIAIPIMGGYEGGSTVDHAFDLWSNHVRYIGVGTMLVGGVWSIFQVRKGIVAGVTGLKQLDGKAGQVEVLRTERNMSLPWLFGIFMATIFATFAFYDYLVGSWKIAALTAAIMVFTAFLFVAVATYIAGLVGSSNSPVSGMTICALLIAAGVMLALGIRGESAILATLGIAGVVCCATCTSGDVAQDLKTGLLVGATPAKQQWTEVIGAIIPAFFFAPILTVLHSSYGIGTDAPGALRAPQAALFASLTEGFFGEGVLPWNMIGIGAAIGVVLIVVNRMLEASGSTFRTHVMPVAVGIYLPLSLDIPILIGGLLRYFSTRRRGETDEARDPGILFGSGLIAGEALMGILIAGFVFFGTELPIVLVDNWLVSLLIFGAVTTLYWRIATSRAES
jgi:putative OPT family oligopeptide transporter